MFPSLGTPRLTLEPHRGQSLVPRRCCATCWASRRACCLASWRASAPSSPSVTCSTISASRGPSAFPCRCAADMPLCWQAANVSHEMQADFRAGVSNRLPYSNGIKHGSESKAETAMETHTASTMPGHSRGIASRDCPQRAAALPLCSADAVDSGQGIPQRWSATGRQLPPSQRCCLVGVTLQITMNQYAQASESSQRCSDSMCKP